MTGMQHYAPGLMLIGFIPPQQLRRTGARDMLAKESKSHITDTAYRRNI